MSDSTSNDTDLPDKLPLDELLPDELPPDKLPPDDDHIQVFPVTKIEHPGQFEHSHSLAKNKDKSNKKGNKSDDPLTHKKE